MPNISSTKINKWVKRESKIAWFFLEFLFVLFDVEIYNIAIYFCPFAIRPFWLEKNNMSLTFKSKLCTSKLIEQPALLIKLMACSWEAFLTSCPFTANIRSPICQTQCFNQLFQKQTLSAKIFKNLITFNCLQSSAGLDGIMFLIKIPDICWASFAMFTWESTSLKRRKKSVEERKRKRERER